MLWDIVYMFYVQYIFGGFVNSADYYNGLLGTLFDSDGNYYDIYTSTFGTLELNGYDDNFGGLISAYMPIGNYLSLIATIITMIVILVLCAQLIKKIYNMCAHVIG